MAHLVLEQISQRPQQGHALASPASNSDSLIDGKRSSSGGGGHVLSLEAELVEKVIHVRLSRAPMGPYKVTLIA